MSFGCVFHERLFDDLQMTHVQHIGFMYLTLIIKKTVKKENNVIHKDGEAKKDKVITIKSVNQLFFIRK